MKFQSGDPQGRGNGMRSLGRAGGAIGKFYAVKRGRRTGIFHSWPECKAQVTRFPGAAYKSFTSQQAAETWLQDPLDAPAPRRHTLGPVPVTGSSPGGGPSPYGRSPLPRQSMSPQAISSFGATGLLTPGTPQAYPSPSESRIQSATVAAQRNFRTTPESSASQQSLHAMLDGEGAWPFEGPAEMQPSEDRPLRALQSQRDGGGWHSLEFDGASKGNPGRGGAGAVLKDPSGVPILFITEGIARSTSNQAEYCALIAGLQEARALGISRLRVQGDSQLVIYQCQGLYAVRHPGLAPLAQEVQELLGQFEDVTMQHVPRERNKLADRLSNDAIVLPDGVRHKAATYQAAE